MRISNNFTMSEFSVSGSFPKMAKGVPVEFKDSIKALVLNVLQPICDKTGWTCQIASGYRSPELNTAIGGALTSQHMRGEAADCIFKDKGNPVPIINVLVKVVELRLNYDQVIAYPTFVHFSYTTKRANRSQLLYNKSYRGKRV